MSRTRLSIGALLPHSALRIPPLLLRHHDQTHLRPEFVLHHGGPRRRHPRPAIDPDLQEVRPRREDDPGARDQHRLPFRKVPHHFHLPGILRSEEHTSELQSRRDLVCRLLLEKKKATIYTPNHSITTLIQ